MLEAVRRDKKVVHGKLHYVLATAIGRTETVDDVTEDEIAAALARMGLATSGVQAPGLRLQLGPSVFCAKRRVFRDGLVLRRGVGVRCQFPSSSA